MCVSFAYTKSCSMLIKVTKHVITDYNCIPVCPAGPGRPVDSDDCKPSSAM